MPLAFDAVQTDRIKMGSIPQDMNDKWFIFLEGEWLFFHRSWTGNCIFGLRLSPSDTGSSISDAWVSRDKACYNSPGIEAEKQLVRDLIRNRLLLAPN